MPKKIYKVNSDILPVSHVNFGTGSGTLHTSEKNDTASRSNRSVSLLQSKFPQYQFKQMGPDDQRSFQVKVASGKYDDAEFRQLLTSYDSSPEMVESTLKKAAEYYGFANRETVNNIIKDGKAKEVLESYARSVTEKETSLYEAPIESDNSRIYLANKEIANMLGMPELYADVEEVTIQGEDGKSEKGVMVYDDDWSKEVDPEDVGLTLSSKKALLNMQVFTMLTGQETFLQNDFSYKVDETGDLDQIKLNSFGDSKVFSYSLSEDEKATALPILTSEMADKIKRIDVDEFREKLEKTGIHPTQVNNVVTNLIDLKSIVRRAPIAPGFYQGPTIGFPTFILDDKTLDGTPLDLIAQKGFLGDFFSPAFKELGDQKKEWYKKEEQPAIQNLEYSMDEDTKNLADTIIGHQRYFGPFKRANSPSYQKIVDELRTFDEKGDPDKLTKLCDDYITSHVNPRTADGQTRLKNITELRNRIEVGKVDNELQNIDVTLNSNASPEIKASAKDKEMEATEKKIEILSKQHKNLDVKGLNLFYENAKSATAILQDTNSSKEECLESAARIIIHSMIRDELDKKEPNIEKINKMMKYQNGLVETVRTSHAVTECYDEKTGFDTTDFFKTSNEVIKKAEKKSSTLSNENLLFTSASANEDKLAEEKQAAIEREEAKEAQKAKEKEQMNIKEVQEEDRKLTESFQKIAEFANTKLDKEKSKDYITKVNHMAKESTEKYEEKYGKSPNDKGHGMS